MSCECCKNDNCTCDNEHKIVDSNLSDAEREMLERIEFAVGYAININMTNFYKRDLMKSLVDERTSALHELCPICDDIKVLKEKTRKELLEDLEKIAQAPDGYSSLKEYMEIMIRLA